MVIDRLDHAAQYYALGKGIETALRFFAAYVDEGRDLPAKTVLDGEDLFVNGVNYTSEAKPQGQLEAHRKYIDVMYVVEGEENPLLVGDLPDEVAGAVAVVVAGPGGDGVHLGVSLACWCTTIIHARVSRWNTYGECLTTWTHPAPTPKRADARTP